MTSILKKIAEAIVFASREDGRHLPRIRGFEAMLLRLADQLKSHGADPEMIELSRGLAEIFTGFDGSEPDRKRDSLERGLRLVKSCRAEPPADNASSDIPLKATVTVREMLHALEKLSLPISEIKGVGPKIQSLFQRKGIETILDLFYFLPRAYEDRRSIAPIAGASDGCKATLIAKVTESRLKWYGRKKIFEVTVEDGSGSLKLKWFKGNELYLRTLFTAGTRVVLTGEVRGWHGLKEMIHPDFEILDESGSGETEHLHFGRIVPIYSETEGLHQKVIRKIMKEALDRYCLYIINAIPESLQRKRCLQDLRECIAEIHFPSSTSDRTLSNTSDVLRTLIFDDFFFFQLGMALRQSGNLKEPGIAFTQAGGELIEKFHRSLPFRLTLAQTRVSKEILADMEKPHPMNRLLLGDVGCGKTVVAMTAMLKACENGYQCAMMAPTEILAEQHYRQIESWAAHLNLKTTLLTGKMSQRERDAMCGLISAGKIDLIIGTHALIQEKAVFHSLGLAVVDEQHRFGVIQRAALRQKGANPDVLFMTATPIPRTLAMTVYGDLDVSTIDELPPGKKEIRTKVFLESSRSRVYEIIRKELEKQNQVFIVYPLVEESEALDLKDVTRMSELLKTEIFPEFNVGMIHGKMKSAEKDRMMQAFAAGDVQILVATTVVEVGIDIPAASLIVIEHAERFGLSQLHQLRGRVGRSDIPSYCILLTKSGRSEAATKRLRIMEETNDGFRIAEEDLDIRGPGEFLGTRQSGLPDFRVGHIVRDSRILDEARIDAFRIVATDPDLNRPENSLLREVLLARWGQKLKFLRAG